MNTFITITGFKHYFGLIPFAVGTSFFLRPETDNLHDKDAIAVISHIYGKVGYVANRKETVAEGTVSAASCRNHLKDDTTAIVRFLAGDYIIAELMP